MKKLNVSPWQVVPGPLTIHSLITVSRHLEFKAHLILVSFTYFLFGLTRFIILSHF